MYSVLTTVRVPQPCSLHTEERENTWPIRKFSRRKTSWNSPKSTPDSLIRRHDVTTNMTRPHQTLKKKEIEKEVKEEEYLNTRNEIME